MDIARRKISEFKRPVSSLEDMPQMESSELKSAFDSNSVELKDGLNGCIDDLKSNDGASNIGAMPFNGMNKTTVQSQLEQVQKNVDNIVAGVIPDISIDTGKLQDGSVTNDKIASGTIEFEKMSDACEKTIRNVSSVTARYVVKEDEGSNIALFDLVEVSGGKVTKTGRYSSAIALSSGAPGEEVEVCFEGIVKDIEVSAGTKIGQDKGVTAFAPVDNVLVVCPKFFKEDSFVTGAYRGDGRARREINLGFYPKAVFVESGERGFSSSGSTGGFFTRDNGLPCANMTQNGFNALGASSNDINNPNYTYHYIVY